MNIPDLPSKFNNLALHALTISSHSPAPLDAPSSLGPPFSTTNTSSKHDGLSLISTFSPKPLMYDLSPTSSASSDLGSPVHPSSSPRSSYEAFVATRSRVVRLYNLPRLAEAYLSAVFLPQSNLRGPIPAPASLWTMRDEYPGQRVESVWAVFTTHEEASAALSLSNPALSVATALESDLEPFHKLRRFVLPNPAPSAARPAPTHPHLRVSSSHPDLQGPRHALDRPPMEAGGDYTLSTNPPNPKTSFRLGDWICSSPKCAAHNFGRNLACIGCGCPRATNGNGTSGMRGAAAGGGIPPAQQAFQQTRNVSSPRFSSFPAHSNSLPNPPTQQPALDAYAAFSQPQQSQQPQLSLLQHQHQHQQPQHPHHPATHSHSHSPAQPSKSAHPLLTPSGRAFAIGGKVQNISSDPLSPCIMYWPDNEPFPEQGQIRPSGLVGVPQPPILNTGNRGPISHQPGDWVCLKCNYLNWRRRKVCQTCLPYAEGNGDSISAAVQAERIALLTSVLAQNQHHAAGGPQAPAQAPRSHSMTPPQQRRPFIDVSPPQRPAPQLHPNHGIHAPVHRSHSHYELGAQYNGHSSSSVGSNNNHRDRDSSPIYQTSGSNATRARQPSPLPLYSTGPDFHSLPTHHGHGHGHVHAPAPLLPSFLQDIVQSPALSPTSTSSADLSFEEYEDMAALTSAQPRSLAPRARTNSDDSAAESPLGNIWRLDGEESKSLSAFALPNSQDLIGSGKRSSREGLRLQVITS